MHAQAYSLVTQCFLALYKCRIGCLVTKGIAKKSQEEIFYSTVQSIKCMTFWHLFSMRDPCLRSCGSVSNFLFLQKLSHAIIQSGIFADLRPKPPRLRANGSRVRTGEQTRRSGGCRPRSGASWRRVRMRRTLRPSTGSSRKSKGARSQRCVCALLYIASESPVVGVSAGLQGR